MQEPPSCYRINAWHIVKAVVMGLNTTTCPEDPNHAGKTGSLRSEKQKTLRRAVRASG